MLDSAGVFDVNFLFLRQRPHHHTQECGVIHVLQCLDPAKLPLRMKIAQEVLVEFVLAALGPAFGVSGLTGLEGHQAMVMPVAFALSSRA